MLPETEETPEKKPKPPEVMQSAIETLKQGGRETALSQYTVLLIEDDPDDVMQITRTLQRSPYIYNVQTFSSGDEVMAHLVSGGYFSGVHKDVNPVMILLDLNLPGTGGIEILRELKEHPLTADIPIIVITGDVTQQRAFQAYKLHANAYLTKPIHLGQIHDVIYHGEGWDYTPV